MWTIVIHTQCVTIEPKDSSFTFGSMVESDGVDERGRFGAFVHQGQLAEDGPADDHHLKAKYVSVNSSTETLQI